MRLFLTGTGTGVGKTAVATGLARALHRRGDSVAAIKPVETGCDPDPADALALAEACARPDLANAPGLYRAKLPVAPYAATLSGEPPPPPLPQLAHAIRAAWVGASHALVEGAGGPLVPYDAQHDFLDLARALELGVLLVAQDTLGVLSHTFTAAASIRARGLPLIAVVLNRQADSHRERSSTLDASTAHNFAILRERLAPVPVLPFEPSALTLEALAAAADRAGLTALFAAGAPGKPPLD